VSLARFHAVNANAASESRTRRLRVGQPFPTTFYDRSTDVVARDLLGATIECRSRGALTTGRIVEVEAYMGEWDPACHAANGRTPRTWNLFGPPGTAYVYRSYGVHWLVNAVTMPDGHGSAVLIRAIEPLQGAALMRRRRGPLRRDIDATNGPGKLSVALGVRPAHDGVSLVDGPIRILAAEPVPDAQVHVTPRIGITKAVDWPLRYLLQDSPYVSRTPSSFPREVFRR
jgi:DNA-3-methyladenine glycosylase